MNENQNTGNQATQESINITNGSSLNYGDMDEQKSLAVLSHVLGLLTGFLGPLIIYIASDGKPWAKENSKNALNFQLFYIFATIALGIAALITFGFALFLFIPLWIIDIVFCITAAVRVNKNKEYKYPITINFIKN